MLCDGFVVLCCVSLRSVGLHVVVSMCVSYISSVCVVCGVCVGIRCCTQGSTDFKSLVTACRSDALLHVLARCCTQGSLTHCCMYWSCVSACVLLCGWFVECCLVLRAGVFDALLHVPVLRAGVDWLQVRGDCMSVLRTAACTEFGAARRGL